MSYYGFFGEINHIKKHPIAFKSILVDPSKLNITSNFPEAKKHCASVTSANIEEILNGNACYPDHYKKIGNGPVISFNRKTKQIMKNLNYENKFINKLDFIKNSIDQDKLVSLLLMRTPLDWHWILCIGYIEYEDKSIVLRIFDNWSNKIRYYIPNKGSKIISATAYHK